MKNITVFRFFSIGILGGILLSGLFCLTLNHFQNVKKIGSIRIPTSELLSQIQPGVLSGNNSASGNHLNINTATKDELMSLPGIGATKALAIISFRERYGWYEDISELTYVPGIGGNLLDSIKDMITISE